MKAKIVRDDIEVNPAATTPEVIRELCVLRKLRRNGRDVMRPHWKMGAVIDFPDCYWLVRQGVAIPADEECEQRAGVTPEEMAVAQSAYERVSKGIHPDDYALFDSGVIVGYDAEGNYLPGPNWHLLEEAAAESVEIDNTPITATGETE
jgi:hypothetical protein